MSSINLGPAGKFVVAALAAAAYYLTDNVLDANDLAQIAVAVLGAAGVYAVPNHPTPRINP